MLLLDMFGIFWNFLSILATVVYLPVRAVWIRDHKYGYIQKAMIFTVYTIGIVLLLWDLLLGRGSIYAWVATLLLAMSISAGFAFSD